MTGSTGSITICANHVTGGSYPTREEERRLFRQYQECGCPHGKIILRNALVPRYYIVINGLLNKFKVTTSSGEYAAGHTQRVPQWARDDLFQVGVLAVMRAIELFDLSRETRFTTAAGVRVFWKMIAWLKEHEVPWHRPAHLWDRANKGDADCASFLTVQAEECTRESIAELFTYVPTFDTSDVAEFVHESITNTLSLRAAEIVRKRELEGVTLEDLGWLLGITRERVRQIQVIAVERLCRIPAMRRHQLPLPAPAGHKDQLGALRTIAEMNPAREAQSRAITRVANARKLRQMNAMIARQMKLWVCIPDSAQMNPLLVHRWFRKFQDTGLLVRVTSAHRTTVGSPEDVDGHWHVTASERSGQTRVLARFRNTHGCADGLRAATQHTLDHLAWRKSMGGGSKLF